MRDVPALSAACLPPPSPCDPNDPKENDMRNPNHGTPRRMAHAAFAACALAVGLPGAAMAQAGEVRTANGAEALEALSPDDAVLVLVDFTSGLFPIIDSMDVDEMLNNAVGAAKVAETFGIPILLVGSEGGFYGELHPALEAFAGEGQPFERSTPSAWASGPLKDAVEATGRGTVLIGGITTDNCTLLTSLGMLRDGYDVRVITDISGSDSASAERAALARLRDAGAVTTSWISLGSELLPSWETPEGAALTSIYGQHMNGPSTSAYGSTADDPNVGGRGQEGAE